MTTVPLRCVQTYRSLTGDDAEVPSEALVKLGRNTEVSLAALDPTEAVAVLEMWGATRRMWNAVAAGTAPSGAWVRTRTVVHHARQDTGRAKLDLHAELAGLTELTELDEFTTLLLSSTPDLDELRTLASAFEMTLDSAEHGAIRADVTFTRPRRWPESLGPGVSVCEAARTLSVVARHAGWRDRAVRRLASVTVTVDELWADPRAAAAAAAA